MSIKNYPSADRVKQLFHYENGRLFWIAGNRTGKEAGTHCISTNRWHVKIDQVIVMRYHVVWVIHHGVWPNRLDHKNRNPLDDRIENLRECTHSQNQANRSKHSTNTSGYKGVSWNKQRAMWMAMISINSKNKNLGYFATPKRAHEAYMKAAQERWGEFAYKG